MQFHTTLWSVVEDAKDSGEDADAALAILCETYWKPLYRHLIQRGFSEEEAKDAVQGFFLQVIEKRYLDAADSSKGRFRTFLLTCFHRYLANEHKKNNAQKRGGAYRRIKINWGSGDTTGDQIATSSLSPDQVFDRDWAVALIGRAIERLRANEIAAGRGRLISALGDTLYVGAETASYEQIAENLGSTTNAVKVAAHRVRKRLRNLIWEEVMLTVDSKDAAQEELKYLLEIIASGG